VCLPWYKPKGRACLPRPREGRVFLGINLWKGRVCLSINPRKGPVCLDIIHYGIGTSYAQKLSHDLKLSHE
jgi:hypothetical protein